MESCRIRWTEDGEEHVSAVAYGPKSVQVHVEELGVCEGVSDVGNVPRVAGGVVGMLDSLGPYGEITELAKEMGGGDLIGSFGKAAYDKGVAAGNEKATSASREGIAAALKEGMAAGFNKGAWPRASARAGSLAC
ncbi:hypothetical protein ACPCKL_33890 [Streptomyces cellulosae]